MPKLQRMSNKDGKKVTYSLNIPKQLVEKKEWKKGDTLFLIFNERGNIEITK